MNFIKFFVLLLSGSFIFLSSCVSLPEFRDNRNLNDETIHPLKISSGGFLSDTNANDLCPFLFRTSDNTVYLFFSSDRPHSDLKTNQYDLYVSKMFDDRTFSPPTLLGTNINSDADELYPSAYESNEQIIFRFVRKDGNIVKEYETYFSIISNEIEFVLTDEISSISNPMNFRSAGIILDNDQNTGKQVYTHTGPSNQLYISRKKYRTDEKIYSAQGFKAFDSASNSLYWLCLESEQSTNRKLSGMIISNGMKAVFIIDQYESSGYTRNERTPFVDKKTDQLYLSVKYDSWNHYNLMRYNKTLFTASAVQNIINWEPVIYDVFYDLNHSEAMGVAPEDTKGYTNGQILTLRNHDSFSNTGHSFIGWSLSSNETNQLFESGSNIITGTEDLHFYAVWQKNLYQIIFHPNLSGQNIITQYTEYQNRVNLSNRFTNAGMNQNGWSNISGNNYSNGQIFTANHSNKIFYAVWTNLIFRLSFKGNSQDSGTVPESMSIPYTSNVSIPANTGNLTKDGYGFAGWNTSSNGTGIRYTNQYSLSMPASDLILYAEWTNHLYRIYYNGNNHQEGSVPVDSTEYTNGTLTTVSGNISNLLKTGFTFSGWNTSSNGTGKSYSNGQSIQIGLSNILLFAQWTNNIYRISYNGNNQSDGTAPTAADITFQSNFNLSENTGSLTKTGFLFAGWNTASNGNGTDYSTGQSIEMQASDLTLYAKWTNRLYHITYNDNGNSSGSVPADTSGYTNGQLFTAASNTGSLTKSGYIFNGWNTSSGGGGTSYTEGSTGEIGLSDITLYAQWTECTWKVLASAGFSPGRADYLSISVDNSGTPYVAFQDFAYASNATVMKFNGSVWETVGSAGFTSSAVWYPSIQIQPSSSVPYLIYMDGGTARPKVQKYTNGSWIAEAGSTVTTHATGQNDIEFDSSGTPYTSYYDSENSGSLTVKSSDGTNWNTVGTASFTPNTARSHDLALSPLNTPYVIYQDLNVSKKATVKKFNGTSWSLVGNSGISAGIATNNDMVINSSGTPFIIYSDAGNGDKAAVKKYDGNAWVSVGSGTISDGQADNTCLALSPSDTLYAAYRDISNGNKATVRKFNGTGWETVGTKAFSSGGTIGSLDMEIGPDGTVYAAFKDGLNNNKATVMKYGGAFIDADPHQISYQGNGHTGGTVPTDPNWYTNGQIVSIGSGMSLNKAGYLFENWNTKADGSGTTYTNFQEYTMNETNVTFYAQWTETNFQLRDIGPAGGRIFYINPDYATDGWKYLEFSPQSTEWIDKTFGGPSTEIGTSTAVGSGESNTANLISYIGDSDSGYAAELCDNLVTTNDADSFDDWFLPSRNELYKIYLNLNSTNDENSVSYTPIDEVGTGNYWSSSEYGSDAWFRKIHSSTDGSAGQNSRTLTLDVRAVRSF